MEVSLAERAVNLFNKGYSCSQAILMAFGQQYSMEESTAKVIARCFGGGMGRTCQTCGAVTGAFIVLALANNEADEKIAKEKTYATIQQFTQKFKEQFGDVNCHNLLGCDLGTTEGQNYFKNNHLISKCSDFVKNAAIILETLNEQKC